MPATPKMLRLTFELHVPVDVSRNIYSDRVEKAAGEITAAVRTLAPNVFPWANELRVRSEWSYLWQDRPETLALPPNKLNTPRGEVGRAEKSGADD